LELCRLPRQLPPGHTHYAVMSQLQSGVALAVGLECLSGSMEGPTVELDDDLALLPTASTRKPATKTLKAGRDNPASLQSSANRCSISVLVAGGSVAFATTALSGFSPRRPGFLSQTRFTSRKSNSRRRSASSTARSSCRRGTTSARSSRVRATLVTGMPSRTVRSARSSRRTRCTSMPGRPSGRRVVLTSLALRDVLCSPHSAAAWRWLSAASGPNASTAAMNRPCRESTG
jgi:hypothetical protein